jgi:hypothetical protein
MTNLEMALRQAMQDDVAAVAVPPDLAARVRDRHRRHRQRVRVSAILVAAAVAVVAVPLVVARALPEAASDPGGVVDEVDGVELTYLPPGLHRGQTDGWDSSEVILYPSTGRGAAEWTAVTGRWYPDEPGSAANPLRPDAARAERGLRLTVFRGSAALQLDDVVAYAWRWWDTGNYRAELGLEPPGPDADGRVRVVADSRGRLVDDFPGPDGVGEVGWWRDIYWSPQPGVVLRVGGSADLADELEAVADGIGRIELAEPASGPADGLCGLESRHWPWVPDPSAEGRHFPGVSAGYVPEGLDERGTPGWQESGIFDYGHGTWFYGYHWVAGVTEAEETDQSKRVSVAVICGEAARDLDTVDRYYPIYPRTVASKWSDPPRPYPPVKGRPAAVVDHPNPDGGPGRVGRTVRWLERPGVVVEVYVGDSFASELDRIIDGIEIDY